MHWTYKNQEEFEIPEGSFGFIYRITDLETDRKYIGRKYLSRAKTVSKRVLKKDGTKVTKKKKSRVESEWQSYMGSCKPLLEEISKKGKDKFKFEILAFANTKGQLSYLEEMYHFKLNCKVDDLYYNESVGPGRYRTLKISPEFIQLIQNCL